MVGFGEKTDQKLVNDFRAGSEEAFVELVRRYKGKAVQIALVTVGNFEDAKDVAQEAFLKIHKGLGGFEMKSEFSTWFYRVLMNTAKDFMRKKKWKVFLSWKTSNDMDNFFQTVSDRGELPDAQILSAELGSQMTATIKKLPFQQQWIFTLRYLKGFSLKQIADISELSEGTVKATLHFAVERFKKEIFPYIQEGGKLS